jgi:hypothetical protein
VGRADAGRGGAGVIEEWKRLADLKPDPRIRLDYAADALVFAELPGVWNEWKRALEGWNVQVSQQVLEWQAEAKAEATVATRRADLLQILEDLYGTTAPADVVSLVQGSNDPEQLSRWLKAAAKARSYDEFRAAISA